ncbi:unnamed protein product [Penicillium pancosmium]
MESNLNPGENYSDLQSRISVVETSLSEIKASLSSQSAENSPRSHAKSLHFSKISQSQISLVSEPTAISVERTTRHAPMSLIQEIKENISSPEETSQFQFPSEDVIANGMVSEDVARILLEG